MNSADKQILDSKLKAWAFKFNRDNKLHGLDYPNICPMFKQITKTCGSCALVIENEFDAISEAIESLDYLDKIIIKVQYLSYEHIDKKCKALEMSRPTYYRKLNNAMDRLNKNKL